MSTEKIFPPDTQQSFGERLEADDNTPVMRSMAPSLAAVYSRRQFLERTLHAGTLAVSLPALSGTSACSALAEPVRFNFDGIAHGVDENHHVAAGHEVDILLRWGDPLFPDSPPFDPENQSAAKQLKQFGYNNDFVGFTPLSPNSSGTERALLCINHEFTNDDLMHPAFASGKAIADLYTKKIADISMAAHGGSVVEIRRQEGQWALVPDSPFNRRLSTLATSMALSGPAAGNPRLRTTTDPTGKQVTGTLNNCAGGITPWGTYLMAEENIHMYFTGTLPDGHREAVNYRRMGIPGNLYPWGFYHDRFHIGKEPNEANRFGWVVEVDPHDPTSTPVKRTALGRFKHEGCESLLADSGQVVIYSGDDQRFEYLYKFVSTGRADLSSRTANKTLLDEGTLYVARFHENGTGTWLPLVFGEGRLNPEYGFNSQADILIEARRAGDILGATPLDRPEDVQPNPVTGKVYAALTNNSKRRAAQISGPNPRAGNLWGQIVELTPENGNHTSKFFTWNILVTCGDPSKPEIGAQWHPDTGANDWFACPDNLAVDRMGRLWVATDQGANWPATSGSADGIWALETEGAERGRGRMLFRAPVGAEICGPCLDTSAHTLFASVQHPASDGTEYFPGFERKSTYPDPATRWPDFRPDLPPRPSVVMITRTGGGRIG